MRRSLFSAVTGIAFLAWALVAGQTVRAQAAPAELMLSWSASTYVPDDFAGRPLPVPGSSVVVTLQAILDGRPTSLSGQLVRWYINERLATSGAGMQSLSVQIPRDTAGPFDVRAELPNVSFDPATKTITVPVLQSQAVIVAPFPGGVVRGGSAVLTAAPYFFPVTGVQDLLFSWTVNGQPVESSEEPSRLDLTFSGNQRASVTATIRNPNTADQETQGTVDLMLEP